MKLRRRLTSLLQRRLGEHKFENLRYHYYKLFVPNLGYNKEYYEGIHHSNQTYYALFAEVLHNEFKPKILLDCGCGRGGHLHVNNQPQSYWIDLFSKNGMEFDPQAVARIRKA